MSASFVTRRIAQIVPRVAVRTVTAQVLQRGYKVLHTSQARAIGGRQGAVSSKDNALTLKLDTPTGLGGKGGTGTNPESAKKHEKTAEFTQQFLTVFASLSRQLFAAGYAACFRGAMGVAQSKLKLPPIPADASVEGLVDIGKHDDGKLGIQAELKVHVPGWSKSDVQKLIDEAHQICPYSHATRNNIKVTLTVV